jgi:type II secretory pathway component PulC
MYARSFPSKSLHSESTTYNNEERSLLPAEIMDVCEQMLSKERAKLVGWVDIATSRDQFVGSVLHIFLDRVKEVTGTLEPIRPAEP